MTENEILERLDEARERLKLKLNEVRGELNKTQAFIAAATLTKGYPVEVESNLPATEEAEQQLFGEDRQNDMTTRHILQRPDRSTARGRYDLGDWHDGIQDGH